MKHPFSLLLITATLSSNAKTLRKDDNLRTELDRISKPYYFKASSFKGSTEGTKMLSIPDKHNPHSAKSYYSSVCGVIPDVRIL